MKQSGASEQQIAMRVLQYQIAAQAIGSYSMVEQVDALYHSGVSLNTVINVIALKRGKPLSINEIKAITTRYNNNSGSLVTANGQIIKNNGHSNTATESRGAQQSGGKGKVEGTEKGTNVKISPENHKYVDILSPEAKQHILYGDSPTSGGHMYPGNSGKTTFPKDWSADKIVHNIGDIATSPNTQWYAQTGTGGIYTAKGKPANWVSYEVRNGIRIRVVYQPATGKIITAFPDKASIPSSYKPIK